MRLFNVWAIDPGGRTGVAHCTFGGADLAAVKEVDFFSRAGVVLETLTLDQRMVEQADALNRIVSASHGRSGSGEPTLIVEGFQFRSETMQTSANASLELIGALRYLAYRKGWEFIEQQASERSVVTNERLKRWGLWTPGPAKRMDHQRDALRHLCVYRRKLIAAA